MSSPLQREFLENGAIAVLRLAAPVGNILDEALVTALHAAWSGVAERPGSKLILLCAEGPHFSYGASVQEHLPDRFVGMLERFHALLAAILNHGLPFVVALRGCCLGGGLELASFGTRIFAAPDARLGQPEIKLGVVAPVASTVLPWRIGPAAAEELLLTGRLCEAEEALSLGLVDELADDPEAAALDWAREGLLPHSAAALRSAQKAARLEFRQRFLAQVAAQERLYVEEVMRSEDAVEGLCAFLEKRAPRWRDR